MAADKINQLLNNYPDGGMAYRRFRPKPDGSLRRIASPNKELKKWLRGLNKELTRQFTSWPTYMHGGIKGRSYVTYARLHMNQPCVINLDIRNCFDTISDESVAEALRQHLALDASTSSHLAQLLCFKGKVAQGFPTSNFICNLYLIKPLSLVHKNLMPSRLNMGSYVDDITISGAVKDPGEVINQVATVLSRAGLAMNKAKVKVMPASKRQIVGGLLVNKRLTLTKKKKLQLLSDLATGRMSEASAKGWISNLTIVDPAFSKKFYTFAVKKKILT